MIVAIIIGVVFVVVTTIVLFSKYEPFKGIKSIPPNVDKTGVYKGKVTIRRNRKDYTTLFEDYTLNFTAQVKEIARFGDEIEVKYLKLVNTPDKYYNRVMDVLKDKHTLIKLKDVEWEYNLPDVILDRDALRKFLNQEEIVINDIHIKISEDVDRGELLDLIIEEKQE